MVSRTTNPEQEHSSQEISGLSQPSDFHECSQRECRAVLITTSVVHFDPIVGPSANKLVHRTASAVGGLRLGCADGRQFRLVAVVVDLAGRKRCHDHGADRVAGTARAANLDVRRDHDTALGDGFDDCDCSRLRLADGLLLSLEARRDRETLGLLGIRRGGTDRLDLGSFGIADRGGHLGLALGFRDVGFCLTRLDLDRDLRLGEVALHVGFTALRFERDACLLGVLLRLEGLLLLRRDLACRQNFDERLREHDVLDVDTADFDEVVLEVVLDVRHGVGLDGGTRLDELHGGEFLQLVPEVVAHCRLQDLVDQVLHRGDAADDARRVGVGHVDLNLQIDLEAEGLAALGFDRAEVRVQAVCLARCVRPVERQDRGRHDLRLVDARVQRVLARAQRFLPDAPMSRLDDRTMLVRLTRGVERRQAHVGLDDADLTLVDDQHRHDLDREQERVQQVGAVEQRVVLQPDASAGLQERFEVLVVVVEVVLRPQQQLDDLCVAGSLGFLGRDVLEATQPACHVARGQRRSFVRRDDADVVDRVVVRVWPNDGCRQLIGRQTRDRCRGALGNDLAVGGAERCDGEGDRMHRDGRAWRQNRPLHTALTAVRHEGWQITEVTECRRVFSGLRTGNGRVADLCDDHADAARRNLHPRVQLHLVERPQLESPARHQNIGLITGFALLGDELVLALLSPCLGDQSDLGRADVVQGIRDELPEEEQHHESACSESDEFERYVVHMSPLIVCVGNQIYYKTSLHK